MQSDLKLRRDSHFQKKQSVQILPRNRNQEQYVLKLLDPSKDIVFGIGPAGTGKTLLAVQVAVKLFKEGKIDKIIVTRHTGANETILVENIEECKYTPYKISYLNKYGVVQDLWFFKRRDERVNISKDQYLENTLTESTSGASYSLNEAAKIPTNIKATKGLTLNTGFVSEDLNEVIQQLLLTERAWIHENSQVYPVIPQTSQLEYKTSLNDKLINFTIDFEYAYNEINLIK